MPTERRVSALSENLNKLAGYLHRVPKSTKVMEKRL
jgi:hypothetical protein